MISRTKVLGPLFFAALTFAPVAGATEILTTSYPGWGLTTTGAISEWGPVFGTATTFNNASGFSMPLGNFGPITVTGPDGASYNLLKGSDSGSGATGIIGATDGTGSMVFTTPVSGLTAFDLILGINYNAAPITITLSDGEVFTTSPTLSGSTDTVNVGLSSITPITSFTLTTSNGSQIVMEDFLAANTNQPAVAPAAEVATALMIGTGLLLFGGYRKVFSNVSAARA